MRFEGTDTYIATPDLMLAVNAAITLERSPKNADVFMRIHNKDGGEVDACGNATRCVGWLVMGESGKKTAAIETNAGLLSAFDTGEPETVTVDMGKPRFGWREIPLARQMDTVHLDY